MERRLLINGIESGRPKQNKGSGFCIGRTESLREMRLHPWRGDFPIPYLALAIL
jgi:hypothetical protein